MAINDGTIGGRIQIAIEEKKKALSSVKEVAEIEGQATTWERDRREFRNQILQKLGLLPSEVTRERLRELGFVCKIGYWFSSVEYDMEPRYFNQIVYALTQKLVVVHFEAFAPYAVAIIPFNEKKWDDMLGLDGADALHRCFKKGRYQKVSELL